ncbi:MAG: hypothetical protein IPL04_15100 [Chitinophagaceae bacterium]|nr:hypothetical protein [Chitinophagaceae bacterium]
MTGLHGRWESIRNSPTVIVDVAHNADGINKMISQIELTKHKNLHLIFGMVADKDVEQIVEQLPTYALYYFTKAQIPRAMSEIKLKELGNQSGLRGNSFPNVNLALEAALVKADSDDLIIIFEVFFLLP